MRRIPVHPFSPKREKWLDFGRHRVSAQMHTLLHWVKVRFHQKTLPDSLMFCATQWLYWLLGDANFNVQNVTKCDPISPLILRELNGVCVQINTREAEWLHRAALNFRELFVPQILSTLGCQCEKPNEISTTGITCGYHIWVADTEAVILALGTKAESQMRRVQ